MQKDKLGNVQGAMHDAAEFCADVAIVTCLQDESPPKDPDMYVRVLRDYGEVAFSMGSVVLKKGSTHFLPRAEADPLIREGVLCPSQSGPIEAFNSSNDYV